MLRITAHPTADGILLQVEGALSGPWVAELRSQLEAATRAVVLDLSGVSFMDAEGTSLIQHACAKGATLRAASKFVSLMLETESTGTSDAAARKEG